jgi:hypothetical protein
VIPADAGLTWGIKRRLLGYIHRLPDGVVYFDDGVKLTPEYDFLFPIENTTEFDRVTTKGVIRFNGYVHLSGHQGAMAVTLASPWLHLAGGAGRLSFDILGDGNPDSRASLFETPFAKPCVHDQTLTWDALRPTLTDVGAELFKSNYAAGTEFDPVRVRLPLNDRIEPIRPLAEE